MSDIVRDACNRYGCDAELALDLERSEHEEVFEALCKEISDLSKQLEEAQPIIKELVRAREKFPWWPTDPIHAAAIVAEEAGELIQACLQMVYEPDKPHKIEKEAIQTAAMALRFYLFRQKYQSTKSEQIEDAGQSNDAAARGHLANLGNALKAEKE